MKLTIVAEVAQGYEGNPTQARLLARAAAASGADLVKYQLVYADELAVPGYRWYDLFRQLEMPADAWERVRDEATQRGIGLAFDVFGMRSLEQALSLGVRVVKIHSTDFFNAPLIAEALCRAPEVHLSLGGITADELDAALERHAASTDKLVLMCGYQAEPTRLEDNHLARLGAMRQRFPRVRLGWMDHADGTMDEAGWLGVLAVPYGVAVIEKHITLARPLELEDGVSALEPAEFARYAERLRKAALAIGSEALSLTDEERGYRDRALKAVVAADRIAKGTTVAAGMVVLKRPAASDGRPPFRQVEQVTGKRLARDVAGGSAIFEDDLA